MKAAENTGYNAILPIGRTGIYPNRYTTFEKNNLSMIFTGIRHFKH